MVNCCLNSPLTYILYLSPINIADSVHCEVEMGDIFHWHHPEGQRRDPQVGS